MKPTYTLGIEEEYQTVDPDTRDLRSHIHAEIIAKGKLLLQERVKSEMHQSVVEVGTLVCRNIKEASDELKKLRRDMIRLARENGLRLAAAATHPFADWRLQEVTSDERYKNIVEDLQLVARANLIFGLHVHVGVEDHETAIQLMSHARYFVPHLETPHGSAKVELRIMYVWLKELVPVLAIVRMGRGLMMGVDHNKNMEWVGSSAALISG